MPPSAYAGPPNLTVATEKTALRAVLAALRERAYAASPDAGQRLAEMFPPSLMPPRGALVSGYIRFRFEIDPTPLMARLAAAGCTLCLPRTPPRGTAAPLSFHRWNMGDPLTTSGFGVLQPSQDAEEVCPDLVLVPMLGFDRTGQRIGYGKGHYDRTLPALRGVKPVTAVGVAFAAQAVDAVPTEATDQRMDWVVTPAFALRASA